MIDRLGCVLLSAFLSGLVLGATAMFYLVKFEIVQPGFNPVPFIVGWMVIVVSWLLGRAVGIGDRKRVNDVMGGNQPQEGIQTSPSAEAERRGI